MKIWSFVFALTIFGIYPCCSQSFLMNGRASCLGTESRAYQNEYFAGPVESLACQRSAGNVKYEFGLNGETEVENLDPTIFWGGNAESVELSESIYFYTLEFKTNYSGNETFLLEGALQIMS